MNLTIRIRMPCTLHRWLVSGIALLALQPPANTQRPVDEGLVAPAAGSPSSFFSSFSRGPRSAPNVVVFIMDDVGTYDIEHVHTPTIDGLAAQGRVFSRGYAMPNCVAARGSLMYGEYSRGLGVVCSDSPGANTADSNGFSIVTPFGVNRYGTAFFGKWHMGTNTLGLPWESTAQAVGFGSSFALVPGNVGGDCDGFEGDYYNWLAIDNGVARLETQYQTLVLRDRFLDWWTRSRGPRFSVVSFQAAHAPFHEPPAELLPYLPQGGAGITAARFDFEKLVITIDFTLSQMLSVVDLRNTYVVLIGDNGTPPNAIGPGQVRAKVKGSPYEGGISVPFIVVGPGIEAGITDSLVSVVDILPTLSELVGVTRDFVDGVSMVPILKDSNATIREHVFASNDGDRAVVQSRYKLIRLGNVERFFDLDADPMENSPISPLLIDPATVLSLRKAMSDYLVRGL